MTFPVANRQPVSLWKESAGAFTVAAGPAGSWRRADASQMARASRSVSGGLVGNSGSGDTFGRESGWTTTAQRQASRDRSAIRCAALRLITLVMLKAGSNPATSIFNGGSMGRIALTTPQGSTSEEGITLGRRVPVEPSPIYWQGDHHV